MARLTTIACAACGAPLRRGERCRWAGCSACWSAVDAYLLREVGMRDPSAWMRASSAAHGDRDEFIRVATAERAA
jgi:hypothetical protein